MPLCDLNCDTGEGIGNDALLMPFITSANIACGFHAGDRDTMRATIELALMHGVNIGAHPSYPDREHFGRQEMQLSPEEIYEMLQEQFNEIHSIAGEQGARLHHVKPHGALYNAAARDINIAHVIAKAVKDFDASLILYGLSGSHLISEARALGLATAAEVFADRTYSDDGSLTPRNIKGALIESKEESIRQVLQMVQQGTVTTVNGHTIQVEAQTICIHGDGSQAVPFARALHHLLQNDALATT